MTKQQGKIIIPSGAGVWPHELKTAEALARAGYTVEFIKKSEVDHQRSADVLMDGKEWEMKSPLSGNLSKVRKVLRKALSQSPNIIYDSQRLKGASDAGIERELRKQAAIMRQVKNLVFINKRREVIDIKR